MGSTRMSNYIIAAVPISLIEVLWDRVSPILQRVVDVSHKEISLESVKRDTLSGNTLLVAICKGKEIVAVNTIEINTLASGLKVLFVPVTGGDELDGWMDQFLEVAEAIGKEHGCQEIRGIAARRGWLRKLKDQGWQEYNVAIGKVIGE